MKRLMILLFLVSCASTEQAPQQRQADDRYPEQDHTNNRGY